jgi:hypothetical protein
MKTSNRWNTQTRELWIVHQDNAVSGDEHKNTTGCQLKYQPNCSPLLIIKCIFFSENYHGLLNNIGRIELYLAINRE